MVVYIKEAHAEDTWPLGLDRPVLQSHTTEARCEAARSFLQSEPLDSARVLVDSAPQNSFEELFAAWPLRFYAIDFYENQHCVSFIAEPHGDETRVEDLEDYLSLRNL